MAMGVYIRDSGKELSSTGLVAIAIQVERAMQGSGSIMRRQGAACIGLQRYVLSPPHSSGNTLDADGVCLVQKAA